MYTFPDLLYAGYTKKLSAEVYATPILCKWKTGEVRLEAVKLIVYLWNEDAKEVDFECPLVDFQFDINVSHDYYRIKELDKFDPSVLQKMLSSIFQGTICFATEKNAPSLLKVQQDRIIDIIRSRR